MQVVSDHNDAVIAEYIRTRGVTRCPTACVVPTQASVDEADRAALEEYAVARTRKRLPRVRGCSLVLISHSSPLWLKSRPLATLSPGGLQRRGITASALSTAAKYAGDGLIVLRRKQASVNFITCSSPLIMARSINWSSSQSRGSISLATALSLPKQA